MKYFILVTLLLSTLQSAPARNASKVLEQDNGVSFIGRPRGDEHLHWIESEDGEILKYNPTSKNYELAEIKDNTLAPSGKKYVKGLKKASVLNYNTLKSEEVNELWRQRREAHRLRMGYGKAKN